VCIIATKLHYTVDVIAANLLVVGVWRFYHHAVASERVKEQYRVLQWIEAEEVLRIDSRAYQHWKKKGVLSKGLFNQLDSDGSSGHHQATGWRRWLGLHTSSSTQGENGDSSAGDQARVAAKSE
jgi:hypothetical protein